jgi:hypothetical protein
MAPSLYKMCVRVDQFKPKLNLLGYFYYRIPVQSLLSSLWVACGQRGMYIYICELCIILSLYAKNT